MRARESLGGSSGLVRFAARAAGAAQDVVRATCVARREAHVRLEVVAEEAIASMFPGRSAAAGGSGVAAAGVLESCRIAHDLERILALRAGDGQAGALALVARLVEARLALEDAARDLAGAVSALGRAILAETRAARADPDAANARRNGRAAEGEGKRRGPKRGDEASQVARG